MMLNGDETLPASSFKRTTSSASLPPGVFGGSNQPANMSVQYQDTLEGLDQKVWQSLAKHGKPPFHV